VNKTAYAFVANATIERYQRQRQQQSYGGMSDDVYRVVAS